MNAVMRLVSGENAFASLAGLTANVLDTPHYKLFFSPDQSINGFETHDNSTVWDKNACML